MARQAGDLIRQRWRDLRASLAATTDPLPWAPALGPRPPDPGEESAWLSAATAVTAYRERYEIPDHTPTLGPRPAPDSRAAWDHACHQADRYLAARLRDLDEQELADLNARQQAISNNPPPFDPRELQRARKDLDAAQGSRGRRHVPTADQRARPAMSGQLLVQRLERAAQAHRNWRRAVTDAQAVRRQITLEERRRRRNPTLVHATRR